jgi:hypothetical protein
VTTSVTITVDVEPSVAGALGAPNRYRPMLHEPVWGEVAGRSEALGFMIRTLGRYDLQATFFVETAHTRYFPETAMGEYVRRLAEAGQDVELHLHPLWRKFKDSEIVPDVSVNDQCAELDEDELSALLVEGRQQIARWTGRMPLCFRTGNFSVSRGVYRAMRQAGLTLASNICVGVNNTDDESLQIAGGVASIEGVTELPVTNFVDHGPVGRGRMRPMQITACGFDEQRRNLEALCAAGAQTAIIVTHPFEYLKWTGYDFSGLKPNRMVQRRFAQLCAFLARYRDRFEVVTLADLASRDLSPEPPVLLHGSPLASVRRAVENFVNDRMQF